MFLNFFLLTLPDIIVAASEILQDRDDIKVKTPNYPGVYPNNSTRVWRFKHEYGLWSVNIEQFHLQNSVDCQADYLEITDVNISKTFKLCGHRQSRNVYTSVGPEILLEFRSDESTQDTGFHLEVLHFFTEDDMERKMKELDSRRATKVNVMMEQEGKITDSVIFYVLVGGLGLAFLLFICLFVWCAVGIGKKNERKTDNYNVNKLLHTPMVAPQSRRYSRANSHERTVHATAVPLPPRQPSRYVSERTWNVQR